MFNLFRKRLVVPSVRQTGLIFKGIASTDHILGVTPSIATPVLMPSKDWESKLPKFEAQSVQFEFDTLACTTFSALKEAVMVLQALIDNGYFSELQLNWLKTNGYFDDNGKLAVSERFTAIMSGTTRQGNDPASVWNSIRNHGLIPDKDFPFGGQNFDDYHNRLLIEDEMREKGKIFKDQIAKAAYAWVFMTYDRDLTKGQKSAMSEALLYAPLQIGIPFPAVHALTLYKLTDARGYVADHYLPYKYKYRLSEGVQLAVKGSFVVQKMEIKDYPEYNFTKYLKMPIYDDPEVAMLQRVLVVEGLLKEKYVTGNFLSLTERAVMEWQRNHGLVADGRIGTESRRILNQLCLKKN